MTSDEKVGKLVDAARALSCAVDSLQFPPPVTHTLNPLDYAWAPHEAYLRKFGGGTKRVIFMGMNPGPFGMVQVGVPCATG
jgi:single-strand selective monofunctional uracil DNA glycosylase